MLEFSPESELDRDLFAVACLEAASSSTPTYIGDIAYDAGLHYERWIAEGSMRTAVNARIGTAHARQAAMQRIPGQDLTVDQIGRICEGPIELLLGLDVAAVLTDSTDARPDLTVDGVRFDVKGSRARAENSFAVPCWQACSGRYDALLLVQHVAPGLARVWCCKCTPGGSSWQQRPPSQPGKKPFFRIACPAPAPAP
jgi:hypothetical protein